MSLRRCVIICHAMKQQNRFSNRRCELPQATRRTAIINVINVARTPLLLLLLLLTPITTAVSQHEREQQSDGVQGREGSFNTEAEDILQLHSNAVNKSDAISGKGDGAVGREVVVGVGERSQVESEAEPFSTTLPAENGKELASNGDVADFGRAAINGTNTNLCSMKLAHNASKFGTSNEQQKQKHELEQVATTSMRLQTTTTRKQNLSSVTQPHIIEGVMTTTLPAVINVSNKLLTTNYVLPNSGKNNNAKRYSGNNIDTKLQQQQVGMQPQKGKDREGVEGIKQQTITRQLRQQEQQLEQQPTIKNTEKIGAREKQIYFEENARAVEGKEGMSMTKKLGMSQRSSQVAFSSSNPLTTITKTTKLLSPHFATGNANAHATIASTKLSVPDDDAAGEDDDDDREEDERVITSRANKVTNKSFKQTLQFVMPTMPTTSTTAIQGVNANRGSKVIADPEVVSKLFENKAKREKNIANAGQEFISVKNANDESVEEQRERTNSSTTMAAQILHTIANYPASYDLKTKTGNAQQQRPQHTQRNDKPQEIKFDSSKDERSPMMINKLRKNNETHLTNDTENIESRLTPTVHVANIESHLNNKNAESFKNDKQLSNKLAAPTNDLTKTRTTEEMQTKNIRTEQGDLQLQEDVAHQSPPVSMATEHSAQGEQQREQQSKPQQSIYKSQLNEQQRYLELATHLDHTNQQTDDSQVTVERSHQQRNYSWLQSNSLLKPRMQQITMQLKNNTAETVKYFSAAQHLLNDKLALEEWNGRQLRQKITAAKPVTQVVELESKEAKEAVEAKEQSQVREVENQIYDEVNLELSELFVGKVQISTKPSNKSELGKLQLQRQHKESRKAGAELLGAGENAKLANASKQVAKLAENYAEIEKQAKFVYNNSTTNNHQTNKNSSTTNKTAMQLKNERSTAETKLGQGARTENMSTELNTNSEISKQAGDESATFVGRRVEAEAEELQHALKYAKKNIVSATVEPNEVGPHNESGEQKQTEERQSNTLNTQRPADFAAANLTTGQSQVNKSTTESAINFLNLTNMTESQTTAGYLKNNTTKLNKPAANGSVKHRVMVNKKITSSEDINGTRTEMHMKKVDTNLISTNVSEKTSALKVKNNVGEFEPKSAMVKNSEDTKEETKNMNLKLLESGEYKNTESVAIPLEPSANAPHLVAQLALSSTNCSTFDTTTSTQNSEGQKELKTTILKPKYSTLAAINKTEEPVDELKMQPQQSGRALSFNGSRLINLLSTGVPAYSSKRVDAVDASLPLPIEGRGERAESETIADWQQRQNLIVAYIRRPDMRTGEALKLNVTFSDAVSVEIVKDASDIKAKVDDAVVLELTTETSQHSDSEEMMNAHKTNLDEKTTPIINLSDSEGLANGDGAATRAAAAGAEINLNNPQQLPHKKQHVNAVPIQSTALLSKAHVNATNVTAVVQASANSTAVKPTNGEHSDNENYAGSPFNSNNSEKSNLATENGFTKTINATTAIFNVVGNANGSANAQLAVPGVEITTPTVVATTTTIPALTTDPITSSKPKSPNNSSSEFFSTASNAITAILATIRPSMASNSNAVIATMATTITPALVSTVMNSVKSTTIASIAADWSANGTEATQHSNFFVLPNIAGLTAATAITATQHAFVSTPTAIATNPTTTTTTATTATTTVGGASWPVKHASVMEGDVILGGLMMVHSREDSITCGPIMPQGGIQALEAMLYTLDQVNKQQLLPNVTLGAHILDDCDKDTYGLEMAVDFIKGKCNAIL